MPMITATNLRVTYGQTKALDGVDVEIQPGEILAILGPSGSGKSTLLHCLAGILLPDEGSVNFAGDDLVRLSSKRRDQVRLNNFGFVFQFGDLVPELTMLENIALPLIMRGTSRREAFSQAQQLATELEIADVGDRAVSQVSGGQAQRAAVARALVNRPAVVFADEPTGSLDTLSGELVLDALSSIARNHGSSVVLVTHAADVAAISDREIVIRDGQVAQVVSQ